MSTPAVVRGGQDAIREVARRLARRSGATYEALDDAHRAMFDELADEVVDYIGEDDFHWGCESTSGVEGRVDDAREQGYGVGVERGLEHAARRMVAGIARLVEAGLVPADAAEEVSTRISRMGVDWSDDELLLVAPQIAATPVSSPKSEESGE